MAFYDKDHQNKIFHLNRLWSRLDDIEDLALKDFQIGDLAQDNNLKLLQTLVLFDFINQPSREGSDAIDCYGHAWELKTCNSLLVSGFSTNHHTNHQRIAIFRKERWMFSIYEGIKLVDVYVMSPKMLEKEYFSKWESKIDKLSKTNTDNPHINNPKISIKFVRKNGIKVYPFSNPPIDPAKVLKNI